MGLIKNTIFVMPEKVMPLNSEDLIKNLHLIKGICTDFPFEIMQIIKKNNIKFLI